MQLLDIKHLSSAINKKYIVQDVSFTVASQSIVVLLGPNGAGKTTLLRTLMGFIPATAQTKELTPSITLRNELITTLPIDQRVARGLMYMPQHSSLFKEMTCKDNLQLVYEHHPEWRKTKQYQAFNKLRDHWLGVTHLEHVLGQKAKTLSGGQQRKLELIRALLMKPTLLMLDEPFAGVDPKSIYELKETFTSLTQQGITLIISDHNVDQLLSIATHVHVLLEGRLIASGNVQDILKNEYTKAHYFGDQFHEEMKQRYFVK